MTNMALLHQFLRALVNAFANSVPYVSRKGNRQWDCARSVYGYKDGTEGISQFFRDSALYFKILICTSLSKVEFTMDQRGRAYPLRQIQMQT